MVAETKPSVLVGGRPKELKIEPGSDGVQVLHHPELERPIRILDFRNLQHQVEIAKVLASCGQVIMFGGVWGVFKGVQRATIGETFFVRAKPERPPEAKIPQMIPPEDAIKEIDWYQVHPEFRYLQDYWSYRKLYSHGAFLHIIVPVRPTLKSLPDIFITEPSEFAKRYPNLEPIRVATVALLWQEDPSRRHFSALVKRFSHTDIYIGVSTANPHGEEPPYTTQELFDAICNGRCDISEIDLIVTDKKYEESGAFASHTQLRLPLVGETPTLKVLRIGSLSIEGFEAATGFQCDPPVIGTKDVRKVPGVSLDEKLAKLAGDNNRDWKGEKPQIFFRT